MRRRPPSSTRTDTLVPYTTLCGSRGGLESNVATKEASAAVGRGSTVRDRILETASALFYRNGVRAVGVDLIVRESGIAKTSLYRHFATKDVLVAAFLKEEDGDLLRPWDAVAAKHFDDPAVSSEGRRVGTGG